MDILEQTEIQLEWPDTNKLCVHPYPTHKRSGGIHLSDILRKIAVSTGQLKDEDRDDEMPIRVFLGLAWEQMAARLYPNMIWQPSEVKRDGIAGSPDGYTYKGGLIEEPDGTRHQDGELIIDEFKYTGKSLRVKGGTPDQLKDIRGEWLWMHQGMGYCNMHEYRPDKVRYHVCWAMGNYTFPIKERYIRYLIQFSPNELEGNWKMVVKNKFK